MEQPIIRASLNRTVVVGVELRRRLEEVARAEGADASYLARRVLRAHLDVHEGPSGVEGEHEH
jgi:predicted transcriptional regulator